MLPALLVASLLAVLGPRPATFAQQAPASDASPPATAATAEDAEADREAAGAVTLGGETILWVTTGLGPYTPQYRAERINQRLREIVSDRSLRDPRVEVKEADGSSELRVGPRLVMVVRQQDAKDLGIARARVAEDAARLLEAAIRAERLRYAPLTLALSGAYASLATVALVAAILLLGRLTRSLRASGARWRARRLDSLRVQQVEIVSKERLGRAVERTVGALHLLLLLALLDVYLTYVLGLFPWTRAASTSLLEYVATPVRLAAAAVVGYLPKLFFVAVIVAFVYSAMRVVSVFFELVRRGRIVFAGFPPEWAEPTNKIARVLLIAFGVVVAFPYLPASGSPAFAGVSVLMGVLFSLASSSSLSNMIAGLVLTYTGAFRLGDRVKIGDAYGDISETALLATRIRTIKNEEVTIPNGVVLGSSVTNYSRALRAGGHVILHTSVTIGYDAPWRTVHELLLQAARETPRVLREPPPFVWQTALNDFYVTYEINAYTDAPGEMPDTYAVLHARIQDAFYAAGVEIMSPHYSALRDGNQVAIPGPLRPSGYQAPAFRVETTPPQPEPAREATGKKRPG